MGTESWKHTPLTAEDVLNAKFQATKFRWGYVQDEVDDFLDEVVATLKGQGFVHAHDVRSREFTRTRFREGYAIADVDALMDAVARTLGG